MSGDLVRRYANGDKGIPADQVWALEAHMETCASCRQLLASHADGIAPLLDTVWAGLTPTEAPARRRRLSTWIAPAGFPWIGMTILVAAIAMLLDTFMKLDTPIVLLVAPIAPMLGVALAWNKNADPMYELVAGTPRAGFELVLRRTAAVLVIMVPVLFLAGLPGGASPALWLLPSLAFTVGALTFGLLIGVTRAAVVLAGVWALVIVAPDLADNSLLDVLEPASLPYWALITVGCVAALGLRADSFARLLR
nr:putative integral membrane protein [Kibdelosporangium sp. MJ126-NF4]